MNDKEFELQHNLSLAREREKQYTKTIAEQTMKIASLKETLRGIAEYADERGAVADLPTEPLWVIREIAHDAL